MAMDLSPAEDENSPISAINVTPFVDVVLVLLVIFMVTTPMLLNNSIPLHLPKAESGAQNTPQNQIGITITKQGQILINGKLATPESVSSAVQELIINNPNGQALISADQDARHGDVVRAIDLVKSAGLQRFAIQIEKP
jgi:biopolymer transport protein ExbD